MIEAHARALLDVLDNNSLRGAENENPVVIAACYGAQAFDIATSSGLTYDYAPLAMARAFLTALIDPLDPALDYLRQDPAAGEKARGERDADGHNPTIVEEAV